MVGVLPFQHKPNLMESPQQIKAILKEYFDQNSFLQQPSELYEPLDYIMGIGGKRLRPLTLLMITEMFGGDIKSALPAAYAIELFHNFSLIHDDVMDDAPLRRGFTTVHEKWDLNTAILSGDAMLIYSYRYLNEACDKDNATVVNKLFSDTAIKVCEGQQWDVNFETMSSVSQEAYIDMIYKKTGALIEGAMMIGATLAGASNTTVAEVGRFAHDIGISFQLQDDILDAYGASAAVGKRIGGDIIQNKKTILYILAMRQASDGQQAQLGQLFSDDKLEDQNKIDQVMAIFDDLNVESLASQIRDDYHRSALDTFDKIDIDPARKTDMLNFVNGLLDRKF